ncbi:hypothetical protein C2E31_18800 [Rhodopirellula baltica]|nr:hypothetical protein C2E31_18800 [Rhodopirellula baltica]
MAIAGRFAREPNRRVCRQSSTCDPSTKAQMAELTDGGQSISSINVTSAQFSVVDLRFRLQKTWLRENHCGRAS